MGKSYKEKKARAKKAKVKAEAIAEATPETLPSETMQEPAPEATPAEPEQYAPVTGTLDAAPQEPDCPDCPPPVAPRRVNWFEYKLAQIKRFFDHNMPRIVWPNDEVDVRLVFTGDRESLFALPEWYGDVTEWYGDVTEGKDMTEFGSVKAAIALGESGIHFDTGVGFHGSDWFLDYSLRGPLRVKFIRKTKNPMRRM